MASALGVLPWLTAQGSRFKKVPALLYIWLTLVGPIVILMLYGQPVPIWYATVFAYSTGAIVLVVALQSSGATISDPEYTKESGMVLEAVNTMSGSVQMMVKTVEQLKDLVKSVIDDKKK